MGEAVIRQMPGPSMPQIHDRCFTSIVDAVCIQGMLQIVLCRRVMPEMDRYLAGTAVFFLHDLRKHKIGIIDHPVFIPAGLGPGLHRRIEIVWQKMKG